jgi:hypothetical protein
LVGGVIIVGCDLNGSHSDGAALSSFVSFVSFVTLLDTFARLLPDVSRPIDGWVRSSFRNPLSPTVSHSSPSLSSGAVHPSPSASSSSLLMTLLPLARALSRVASASSRPTSDIRELSSMYSPGLNGESLNGDSLYGESLGASSRLTPRLEELCRPPKSISAPV